MLKENCIAEKLFEFKRIKRKCCYHILKTQIMCLSTYFNLLKIHIDILHKNWYCTKLRKKKLSRAFQDDLSKTIKIER